MPHDNHADVPLHSAPRPIPVWVQPLTGVFIGAVLLTLFVLFFNAISTVMLGVLAAAIVSATLSPILRFIPGPRGVAAGLLGLTLIASVAGLLLALSLPLARPITDFAHDWPKTRDSVNNYLDKMTEKFGVRNEPTAAERKAAEVQEALQLQEKRATTQPVELTGAERHDVDQRLRNENRLTVEKLLEQLGNFLTGEGGQRLFSRSADVSLSILLWLVFIFIGSIFFMTEPHERLLTPALSLAPPRSRQRLHDALEELSPRLRRWVVGTLLSMAIVFSASAIGYYIVGLHLAGALALVAGLCEIVPTVGPAVSCVIAVLFAAATGGGGTVVGVLIVYACIQSIEAYVILPMIMRGAVKIHPAVTLFSVVLWGKIFGVPGLVLAIPINLTLWSLARQFFIKPNAQDAQPPPPPDPDRSRVVGSLQ